MDGQAHRHTPLYPIKETTILFRTRMRRARWAAEPAPRSQRGKKAATVNKELNDQMGKGKGMNEDNAGALCGMFVFRAVRAPNWYSAAATPWKDHAGLRGGAYPGTLQAHNNNVAMEAVLTRASSGRRIRRRKMCQNTLDEGRSVECAIKSHWW